MLGNSWHFSNHQIAASRGAAFYWQMSTAWIVLLVEPLHGVTFALAWTAAIDFVKKPEVSGRTTRVMKLLFVDCRVGYSDAPDYQSEY